MDEQKLDYAILLNSPKIYDDRYEAVLIKSEEFAIF